MQEKRVAYSCYEEDCFRKKRRLNPFNPLSYVTVVITLIVGILMFGFVGVWKETELKNPFKWQ